MSKQIQLRDYQSKSINMLYDWMSKNDGHPCVVLPTGSGKSVIIADLIRGALQSWPETKVLMICHQKELIEQNAEKMRKVWPNAPMGIYSASVGRRQLGEPITFAGIQSIHKKANLIGHIDICIVDECHCISHKNEGTYRKFIDELLKINPAMRVVGYSATPYRLGHGLITDKPALFDGLLEPTSIEELVYQGYLAPLRSKVTKTKLDVTGVHKRGGDYIESELQKKLDTVENNESVVQEVIEMAGDRKAWIFFCTGVDHAKHVSEVLKNYGIAADCITGNTPKLERENMLARFKSGELRALCSVSVLTTGFDYPDVDLIVMMRPTQSATLYIQIAGRGMRPKSHTDHCLVLDFAGNVATHGPVTAVQPPKKTGEGTGTAPVKVCEECGEICAISARVCPACGNPFPEPEAKVLSLHDDDIMGLNGIEMEVTQWVWRKHVSRSSGKEMLSCTYYGGLSDKPVTEYLTVLHEGYAGEKSRRMLLMLANKSQVDLSDVAMQHDNHDDLEFLASRMNEGNPPSSIEYKADGKFFRVIKRIFENE